MSLNVPYYIWCKGRPAGVIFVALGLSSDKFDPRHCHMLPTFSSNDVDLSLAKDLTATGMAFGLRIDSVTYNLSATWIFFLRNSEPVLYLNWLHIEDSSFGGTSLLYSVFHHYPFKTRLAQASTLQTGDQFEISSVAAHHRAFR